MRMVRTTLITSAVLTCSCGSGMPTRHPESLCETSGGQAHPMVVDWSVDARSALREATARGTVVVRFTGCDMEILDRCRAPGSYQYTPTTPRQDKLTITDQRSLYANVPVGAASLAGDLRATGQLNVDMTVVGQFDSDQSNVSAVSLDGDCSAATHYVTSVTVGAFVFGSAESDGASVGVSSAGIGVQTGRSR
ncbi:MAG: hypothetical protein FWD57_12025, partial [Polyangiaceae bacterium]|nr:hypothetical protein [Polyangiaceae bacterium]